MEKVFSSKDILIASVIMVEDFVYVSMEKNNNRPWLCGDVLFGKKNNLFVRDGKDHLVSITNGERFKILSAPCKLGEIGVDESSIEKMDEKFKFSYEKHGIKSLKLSSTDAMVLESEISQTCADIDAELWEKFDNFMAIYDQEKENG